jgi:hypothetical protein
MSDISDYIGRTIDVLAYDGAKLLGRTLLTQALANENEGGKVTTGIQKLSQRVLIELMTEKGSMQFLPERGTEFLLEARQGYLNSQLDVFMSVARASVDVINNLRGEESESDPDDERIDAIETVAVTYSPGEASVTLKITSLAGDARPIILPVSVPIFG